MLIVAWKILFLLLICWDYAEIITYIGCNRIGTSLKYPYFFIFSIIEEKKVNLSSRLVS